MSYGLVFFAHRLPKFADVGQSWYVMGTGAAWVTRTPDPRITNAMLYQLS